MTGWGELERGDLAVGTTRHPLRKQVCVTVRRGSVVYTAAYCRSEEEADQLWAALRELVGAAPIIAQAKDADHQPEEDLMLPADLVWCPGAKNGEQPPCSKDRAHLGHYLSAAELRTTATRPQPNGGAS